MGRAKLAMEYIKKDKARNTTFEKRKKGLKKKAQELATLCDVPLCVIIYQGPTSEVETFPSDRAHVRSVIDRYRSVPREESAKRNLNLQSILESKKKKAEKDLLKVQNKTNSGNGKLRDECCYAYPTWSTELDGLNKDQLFRLSMALDKKIKDVEERIGGLRGGFGNLSGNGNAIMYGNVGGSYPCYEYDPSWYYGQLGPHENAAFGGGGGGGGVGGSMGPQPISAVYGGSVRVEPHQMGGASLGLDLFEQGRFMH